MAKPLIAPLNGGATKAENMAEPIDTSELYPTRDLLQKENSADDRLISEPFGNYAPTRMQRFLIALARKSFLHRGKFRHMMSDRIYAIRRPVDIHQFGCNFRVGAFQNLIEYGVMLHPTYNGPERAFLSEPLAEGKVAVDIGSNIGLYSLPLARTGARVISIDANLAMVEQLKFNMRASGMDDSDAVHAAVGDVDGRVNLQIRENDVAIVSVVEDASGDVEIKRLETILNAQGVTRVDVLKIDIEGFEDKALAPFLENASEDMIPDRIVIERAGAEDYPACVKQFDRLGYKVVGRTRSNSLYQRFT